MHKYSVATLVVAALAVTGCAGGDSNKASSTPAASSDERSDVEAAVLAYFTAATPQDVCGHITLGLEGALDNESQPIGDPSAPADTRCVAVLEAAARDGRFGLDSGDPRIVIELTIVEGPLAAVRVLNDAVSNDAFPVFLVKISGRWLVDAQGFTPPGFTALAEKVALRDQSLATDR